MRFFFRCQKGFLVVNVFFLACDISNPIPGEIEQRKHNLEFPNATKLRTENHIHSRQTSGHYEVQLLPNSFRHPVLALRLHAI